MGFIKNFLGGRLEVTNTPPRQQEHIIVVDEKKPSPMAIIYRSEIDFISRCILDYPNIETGGQLFGFWTSDGTPVVMYVIGPGTNAQHHQTSFVQDQNYPDIVGRELHRRYRLQHIGEWHSHHQLDLARPSGGDVNAFVFGLRNPRFPRLLLCIGNCTPQKTTVNAFNFHKNDPHNYVHARWDIVEHESPYRSIADHDLNRILIQPHTRNASHGQLYTVEGVIPKSSSSKNHWLTESVDNVEMMKAFVEDVKNLAPEYPVKTEMLPTGEPLINIDNGNYKIVLPYGFPQRSPILENNGVSERIEATIISQMEIIAETWGTNTSTLRNAFQNWLKDTLAVCLMQERKCDPGMSMEHAIAPQKPHGWRELHERLEKEMKVLTSYYNFTNDTLIYYEDKYSYEIEINMVAYNPKIDCHTVIKILIPSAYPSEMPDVVVGESSIGGTQQLPIASYLQSMDFTPLYSIIDRGHSIYRKMLNWTSQTSLARAFFVANLLLIEYAKATQNGYSFQERIDDLLESEEELDKSLKELANIIKENNNNYGSITT